MVIENYIPQIIISGVILLLNPTVKFVAGKIIANERILGRKTEIRINQTTRLLNMLINGLSIACLAVTWGVRPDKLIVALSTVFTVIGVAMFAQWSILSNITAGIVMFFSMPFRIGDEINILDKETPITARVENAMTFTIHLRTEEGELIIMTNTQFMQKIISIKDK